jgi:hypothetical protein
MTIAELISELRAARDDFEWEFRGSNNWIRGVPKNSDLHLSLDPVSAVCFSRTRKVFDDSGWVDAGKAIGLSSGDCMDVLEAAMNRRVDDIYNEWLRRQLTFAVGLHSPVIPPDALRSILNLVVDRI